MRIHLKTVAFLSLFLTCTFSLLAQESNKNAEAERYAIEKRQKAEAQKKSLSPEVTAGTQTNDLVKLLDLDENQETRVYGIFLSVQKKAIELSDIHSEGERTYTMNDLERIKNEKLKEILTEDQYLRYLKSIKEEIPK